MYYEAYGICEKNLTFIAVRFTKPILRINIKGNVEPINTDNILVIYSKQAIDTKFNTLTFGVNTKTNGIYVSSGEESNLLKHLFNQKYIYIHCYHKSILYLVCSNKLVFNYEKIAKNKTFNALFNVVKSYLNETINIKHFQYCKYFKRNNLKWQKWSSWWHVVQKCINSSCLISDFVTLQLANQITKIFKNSQKDFTLDYSDLYKCEIELIEKPFLGIAYRVEENDVIYVSPMIVAKCKTFFKDVNFVECTHWLPLYFNKIAWLSEGLYFYLKDLTLLKNHLKQIMHLLNDSEIEKYKFIQKDLMIVNSILN